MYFSDKITLRAVTYGTDKYGGITKTYTDKEVYADKRSVSRAEFYSSNVYGIKITAVFAVFPEDYGDEPAILHNGIEYNVIRAYQKGAGVVELMCAKREVENGN